MLTNAEIEATGKWLAGNQEADGAIAWWPGEKFEAWDHCHCAMGLTIAGHNAEAYKAYRFLANTQLADGAWPAESKNGVTTDAGQESNHAAFIASAIWFTHLATDDTAFMAEMWPTVERAINFVLRLRADDGTISWALSPDGQIWRAPILSGCSSIHGSLVCAIRIAEHLGYERPLWSAAREGLAAVIRDDIGLFDRVNVPETPGRYSMDWYYPVLGGALRGEAARERLADSDMIERFLREGYGLRCVADAPWYTVAETCEFIVALDACGFGERAREVYSWMPRYRRAEDGAYWTGLVASDNAFWPEPATWTASALLLADDALRASSPTCDFFRSLAGDDLGAAEHKIAS